MSIDIELLLAENQAFKAQLAQRDARIERLQISLTERDSQVMHLSTWIEKLKLQIAVLKRLRFGRSSEQLDAHIAQMELIVDDLECEQAEQTAAQTGDLEPSTDSTAQQEAPLADVAHRARKLLPEHLPRETLVHAAACACPSCGSAKLRLVGETVSEQLEFVPEHFKVIRHVREKFSCADCSTMVQAPAPSRPLGKSPVGPGLLAHVLVSKYMDHLPLYRQSAIYERQGLHLERSTLADWVGGASVLLRPLINAIQTHVLAANKLHADDTPVPVLQPGRSTTKQGRLRAYVRDDTASPDASAKPAPPSAVWFAYSPDRKGIHPQGHLKSFKGILQADGYAGFGELYKSGEVKEAACWAHARRNFYELAQATGSPVAKEALQRIAALYAIEKAIRGKPPEHRAAVRQEKATPLLTELKDWFTQTYGSVSKKSALAQAIAYSLTRWEALTRYTSNGSIEIDNNIAERQIRPIALGRKNYLFAGSDQGGQRAAAIYSLLGTAKMHGLNPQAYLTYVFERINDHKINAIAELLPWNVPEHLKILQPDSNSVNDEQDQALTA